MVKKRKRDNRPPQASTSKAASRPAEHLPLYGRILLIGEANMAFARSLIENELLDGELYATTLDSEEISRRKYDHELDENLSILREHGTKTLFGVDATQLEKCKPIKGLRFDCVVWNYPHLGNSEKNEAKNIRSHQALLLRFLGSVAPFLAEGTSQAARPKKRRRKEEEEEEEDADSLDEDERDAPRKSGPGSVLITLREAMPYSAWDLPSLAKRGPQLAPSILPHPFNRRPQPAYSIVKSQRFDAELYPGYAHRRTIGFVEGISTEDSIDTRFSAADRKKAPEDRGAETTSRTWQLQLKR